MGPRDYEAEFQQLARTAASKGNPRLADIFYRAADAYRDLADRLDQMDERLAQLEQG